MLSSLFEILVSFLCKNARCCRSTAGYSLYLKDTKQNSGNDWNKQASSVDEPESARKRSIFFEIIEPQWRHHRISTASSNFHKVEASPRGPKGRWTPITAPRSESHSLETEGDDVKPNVSLIHTSCVLVVKVSYRCHRWPP